MERHLGFPASDNGNVFMHRWFQISADKRIDPGCFLEGSVSPVGDVPIESMDQFIDELASRLMHRYESKPVPQFLSLENVIPAPPERTRHFYRRLILPDGTYTAYFETWASETLGEWIEETFESPVCIESGKPHGSDPAYDIITLIEEGKVLVHRPRDGAVLCRNLATGRHFVVAGDTIVELGFGS